MIAWMLYCAVAGALLAVTARAAEWVARIAGVSVRWCWAIAMALLVALAAVAPFRKTTIAELPTIPGSGTVRGEAIPLQAGIDAVSKGLPSATVVVAAIGWTIASGMLLFIILAVHSRLRRVRHSWPLAEMHGARVRVAPEVGPVVIGFRVPEIIVPRWLLARTAEEQWLIVTHEAEHVRAKDMLLLGAGIVLAALMPWNPFVWYMFSRLRLAVELDCDARVLKRGTTIESYGSLLIDVAAQAIPMRFGVAALAGNTSHLHERIVAMKQIVPKYARLRAGVVGVLGAAALLAACEAKMPTSAEVEGMDVGTAERRLALAIPTRDSIRAYMVDGKEVSREQAFALTADTVAEVRIEGGAQARMRIATRKPHLVRDDSLTTSTEGPVRMRRGGSLVDVAEHVKGITKSDPLILVDGVRVSPTALRALSPNGIASVDVIKGSAVKTEYPGFTDAEIAGGVIRITTKK